MAAAVRYGVAYVAFKDSEASWRNTKRLLLWTNVEMGLVMVAVMLPAFRVILRAKGRSGEVEETRIPEEGGEVRLTEWEIRQPVNAVERGKDEQGKEGFGWGDEFRDYESEGEEVGVDEEGKRSESLVQLCKEVGGNGGKEVA